MRKTTGQFLERCRVKSGPLASDRTYGFNGAFFVPFMQRGDVLKVIASDGAGWEHVSVSLPNRCPTWNEMHWIKEQFWEPEEAVMQLHPPESTYVNNVRFCLHLWRPTEQEIPLPPMWAVGIQNLGVIG